MTKTMTDDEALAAKLAKSYQYERNRCQAILRRRASYRVPRCWTRSDGREGRGPTVWVKLARLCLARTVDGVAYIQWCLDPVRVFQGAIPEPNQLLSLALLSAYQVDLFKCEREVALALSIQRRTAWREIAYLHHSGSYNAEDAHVAVICSRHYDLSPLFRHCLALKIPGERFAELAATFEEPALLQYQRQPAAYDRHWRGWIPPDFADRAGVLYDHILDQEA
jgi:hypothetical protein